jgi:hypothetical protein
VEALLTELGFNLTSVRRAPVLRLGRHLFALLSPNCRETARQQTTWKAAIEVIVTVTSAARRTSGAEPNPGRHWIELKTCLN